MTAPANRDLGGPFGLSLALHGLLILLFVIGIGGTHLPLTPTQPDIVQAHIVDELPRQDKAAVARARRAEVREPSGERNEPDAAAAVAQRVREQAALREAELEREREARKREQREQAEQQSAAKAAAQARAAEEARVRAEADARDAALKAEARRKAEADARAERAAQARADADREAREKAEAEARQKADQAAKLKARQEAEAAKARAERQSQERAAKEAQARAEQEARAKAEAKRQADQERLAQVERERELKEQLEAEQTDAKLRVAIDDAARRWLSSRIEPRVQGRWLRPPSAADGMTCIIAVRTTAAGQVIAAQVTKSSGDPAFDRSAEAAVRKASPLPMPPDPKVAQEFLSFSLKFKP
jgi:colicin import membrane protein